MADCSFILGRSVFFGVLVIMNLFGNILVCAVIIRNQFMKTPLNYLLFNLAVADMLTGVFAVPENVFSPTFQEIEGVAVDVLCKLFGHGNLNFPCNIVSALSLAAIAYERYQAVVYPLTAKDKITKRRSVVFIAVAWVVAIGVSVPRCFGFGMNGNTPPKCTIKSQYGLFIRRFSYALGTTFYGLPLIVMIILYGRVIWELLKKAQVLGNRNTSGVKKKITVMLIAVTLIFAFLWGLSLALILRYGYNPKSIATSISNFAKLANSSINWVLYALFSEQFRACFRKALCGCCETQPINNVADQNSGAGHHNENLEFDEEHTIDTKL